MMKDVARNLLDSNGFFFLKYGEWDIIFQVCKEKMSVVEKPSNEKVFYNVHFTTIFSF